MSERRGAAALPTILPIFPLTSVLLLPRGRLPLNIFEPRYLAMTRDALAGERLIGMVQPSDPGAPGRNPQVYPIGCAGRITSSRGSTVSGASGSWPERTRNRRQMTERSLFLLT